MKRVLTYGTFDLLHVGHIRLLERARKLGDHLTVGISTDDFNEMKNKKSILNYADRAEIVRSIKFVDEVIQESDWEQKINDVLELGIDVFVMGDDWKGKFDFLSKYCEVVYLSRTDGVSTTILKSKLGDKDAQ